MRALLREVLRRGTRLVVPAAVLGQVWRDGARQVMLRALLAGPTTEIPPLDRVLAEAAGILCGRTKTSDVIDASVVLVARAARGVVISSDVPDLHRLDPALAVQPI
ncbi:MAG TPA: PIN domain nuclease [Polyangia bacterium]|nr:PIN domain nuclease [Polyangia bacterium]